MDEGHGRVLRVAIGSVGVVLLGACAQVEHSVRAALERNLSLGAASSPGEKLPADYLPVTKSELANFFHRFPRTGPDTVFPRVAVTMLEAPSWHMEISPPGSNAPAPGCWKFRAVIWTDAKASREVPPFHFCNFDRELRIVPLDRFALSAWGRMRVRASLVPSSGQVRTDGPDRPFAAIPASLDENTFTYNAISQIVAATGISVHDGDPRLWVNFAPSLLR